MLAHYSIWHYLTLSPPKRLMESDGIKVNDTTPRAAQDLRFTPSFVDPNSLSYMNFPAQQSGYYTPNSEGLGPLFHSQAGDLHTPGMSMITPMSLTQQLPGPTLTAGGRHLAWTTMISTISIHIFTTHRHSPHNRLSHPAHLFTAIQATTLWMSLWMKCR